MGRRKTGLARGVLSILTLACLLHNACPIHAQGAGFSYQGRLSNAGTPANGNYDFQFSLYDTAAVGTGTQQGNTASVSNLPVTNGIFTVTLDFGAAAFPGASRFLEIAVKAAGGSFMTLVPRQPVNSTPYALRSLDAAEADGLSVACVNCVTSSQIGSVNASAIVGTVTANQLAAGAAAANLNAANQSAVASGGVVLSAVENTALLNAGYIRIGTTVTEPDSWLSRAAYKPAANGRNGHTAVWTGSEMIVWGGYNGLDR